MSSAAGSEADPDRRFDVVGVGNAIVDVVSLEEASFVERMGLEKGAMTLIDAERAEEIYAAMGSTVEVSGGSAANTMAGLASFGANSAYMGRIGDDEFGRIFGHDLRALGVWFEAQPSGAQLPTGRCLVVVTPDGQRTLNTLLGAAGDVGPEDVHVDVVSAAQVTYLEGYLFDKEPARQAFARAAAVAHDAGRKVALTLSDSFCVARARDEFRALVADEIDVLFGNEDELRLLYDTDDVDAALGVAATTCGIVVATRGAAGSTVAVGDERHHVPAEPVEKVVDTTGAGDLYAAGFLHGLTRGLELDVCGRLGSLAAAEIISHVGARPEAVLAELAEPVLAGRG